MSILLWLGLLLICVGLSGFMWVLLQTFDDEGEDDEL